MAMDTLKYNAASCQEFLHAEKTGRGKKDSGDQFFDLYL